MFKKLSLALIFLLLTHISLAKDGAMMDKKNAKATFAGGCFWCMQPPFDKLKGVVETTVGYTGGQKVNPAYKEVSSGTTGHCEAIEIIFDPAQISYAELLDVFWRNIDPTDSGGQFVDRGNQYRAAIFYHNEEQKQLAQESKERLAASGRFKKPIVTEITPVSVFYPAEEYHQKYYVKSSFQYKYYRFASGRDQFLQKFWGKEAKH